MIKYDHDLNNRDNEKIFKKSNGYPEYTCETREHIGVVNDYINNLKDGMDISKINKKPELMDITVDSYDYMMSTSSYDYTNYSSNSPLDTLERNVDLGGGITKENKGTNEYLYSNSNVYSSKNTLVEDRSRVDSYKINSASGLHTAKRSETTHAIDGALSVTIRQVGYINQKYGEPIKHLGAGTGGQVKLFRKNETGELIAIKFFKKQSSKENKEGRVTRSCLAELAICVNVDHPNIIRTSEVIMEYNQLYYAVMEYCPIDLFTLLQAKKLTKQEINCYFGQLINGISYLHRRGIAHRDLKLDNLCVTLDGTLKIIDFGCSTIFRRKMPESRLDGSRHNYNVFNGGKQLSSVPMSRSGNHDSQGTYNRDHYENTNSTYNAGHVNYVYVDLPSYGLCGSDPYIAPELYLSDSYDAKKVDVWAAGIIFLSMHNLHFPWDIAHPSKDKNFRTYIKMPAAFIECWLDDKTGSAELIKKMLEIQPKLRIGIEDVYMDPWYMNVSVCTKTFKSRSHFHYVTEKD